jgi:hypothetical protein
MLMLKLCDELDVIKHCFEVNILCFQYYQGSLLVHHAVLAVTSKRFILKVKNSNIVPSEDVPEEPKHAVVSQ